MVDNKVIQKHISKLKKIAQISIKRNYSTQAQAAISACAEILYKYNQYYTDDDLESFISQLSKRVATDTMDKYNDETILFYDGFGLDTRGLAVSFIKALRQCSYKVVYVTKSDAIGKIPHIIMELGDNIARYINMSQYDKHVKELNSIFRQYHPKAAFFYTLPYDVSGAVVFNAYKNKVKRIQVDLTDHAFWLGVNAADYFMASRLVGAGIEVYERKIDARKIIRLDVAPYINCDAVKEKLPFDIKSARYVFSGGALYKTLGDPNLYYYKMVNEILSLDEKIYFLYAGRGDSSQFDRLKQVFPGRVFLTDERADFYELIRNCLFYLNTYPMFGGLMMRYSALAGKVPLTLRHDKDADGILFGQKNLNIEFESYEDAAEEIKKLLFNVPYRKKKEEKLKDSVMDSEKFKENLQSLIEHNKTSYEFEKIESVDTRRFRSEYKERFDFDQDIVNSIVKRRNISLFSHYPIMFIKGILIKLRRKL